MILIFHKKQQIPPSNQSGFTIIESLVAVLVVAILLTAIAPVIVLSVATRVQARRVELASDAAKSYIDGVRSGIITPPDLPSGDAKKLEEYEAPSTGTLKCTANNYCSSPANNLYCIDGDGSGCSNTSSKDLIIQAFRYNKDSTEAEDGYGLGIRVYRADAFNKSKVKELKASKDKDKNKPYKQQQSFGGTNLSPIQTPLLEMSTEISTESGFDDFCTRLKNDSDNDNEKSKC